LRSYSKYLGFDPEEFVELFNSQKREIERTPKLEEESFCAVEKNTFNTKKIFIVVVAVIVIALLIIFVCLYRNMSKIAQTLESDNFKQVEYESLQKQKIEDDVAVMEQDEPYSEEKIPDVEASIKQNLEIEAKETVWIKVDIDGKTVYEGTLLKGGKKMWEADNSFTLKVGYAPGVKVFFNGESIDVVSGAAQDVNTIVLKKK
jgi:cytoskeletal protein RodZ